MSNNIVQFNEEIFKGQIKELVRGSVEVHMAILSGQRGHNPGPLRAIIGGQPKT